MTTFRLLRQSNRASRFAQVTVEVAASSRPEIEVTATIAERYRREAELGVRWALARLTAATKVTVTDVVTTDVDTSAGDVYEAAAHAVWQALGVEHDVPYVGFSDPGIVTTWLQEMLGRRLDVVTEARHWHQQRREPDAERGFRLHRVRGAETRSKRVPRRGPGVRATPFRRVHVRAAAFDLRRVGGRLRR